MKKKYKVYLKSGQTLTVKCDEFTITSTGGLITGWHAEGFSKWLTIDPTQIAAVARA